MMKIACIGAGNVGRARAVVLRRAGCDVAKYDLSAEQVTDRALPRHMFFRPSCISSGTSSSRARWRWWRASANALSASPLLIAATIA